MADLSFAEKRLIENAFGMGGGWVLDFSNRTFQEFIADSVGIDVLTDKYKDASGSKAHRLRALLRIEPNTTAAKVLRDLTNYACDTLKVEAAMAVSKELRSMADRLDTLSTPTASKPSEHLIFVSYARPDQEAVGSIVQVIEKAGYRTWYDKKDLLGGQDWKLEIRRRIAGASLFVICLSTRSVSRRGFFQQEMKLALDEAMNIPRDKAYIVPIRLDNCEIPDDLQRWHAIDVSNPEGVANLLRSISAHLATPSPSFSRSPSTPPFGLAIDVSKVTSIFTAKPSK